MASVFPLFIPIALDVCRTLITILDSLHTHRPDIQQVNKQQLKVDMEQQTGSKLGKEYVKAVCCHPTYLTYIRVHHVNAILNEAQAWNQDCWEKYQ